LAGLKTASVIIPDAEMRNRFTAVLRSHGLSSPNMFGPLATEAAYRYGEPWLEELLDYLQGNITFLTDYARERIPGLKVIRPEGTYLVWLDFRACGIKPDRLGKFVREDARVGLESGITFGCQEEGFERMNIACPRSILAEGMSRLEKAVKSLR
jgi:cystathionine beta-lyase